MSRSAITVLISVCVALLLALLFMRLPAPKLGYSAIGPREDATTTVAAIDESKPTTAQTEVDSRPPPGPRPTNLVQVLSDDFNNGVLDPERWAATRMHDFAEFDVNIVKVEGEEGDGRLRLRCGTRGTDDRTVKALGAVSLTSLPLSGKGRLSLDFDWNKQANGCYLTGAIYLCPTLTKEDPEDEPQWLRLEYVGVPPGKNARLAIWLKDRRTAKWLYNEGWPKEQRTGRPVEALRLEIQFDGGQWTVLEDGKKLFESTDQWKLPFDKAHLYLQMTSHSNYPPREIFFDNVQFGCEEPARPDERGDTGTTGKAESTPGGTGRSGE